MHRPARPGTPRGARGFVLLEALVAVAIVGVALLFLTGLLQSELRLDQRAREQQLALRALESAVEGIRAGVLVKSKDYDAPEPPFVVFPPGADSHLSITISNGSLPGLSNVLVKVRFRHGPDLVERSLGSRVWMP